MRSKIIFIIILLTLLLAVTQPSALASSSKSTSHNTAGKSSHRSTKESKASTASAKQPNYLGILLDNHKKIHRTVKNIPNGVVTVTTSKDPKVAKAIQDHALQMYGLMKQGKVVRPFDPLFVALFKYEKHIHHQLTFLHNGLKVIETSKNPYVVKLIQEHAHVVLDFVKRGYNALPDKHPIPPMTAAERRELSAKTKQSHSSHSNKASDKSSTKH